MEAYLGYVMFTAGSFAPRGWSLCQGQLVGIAQNTALYSLLGIAFGGDGSTTFGLPNLGGRALLGTGQAPGVGHNYQQGEVGGTEQTTIMSSQMPMHVHGVPAQPGPSAVTDNNSDNTYSSPSPGAYLGSVIESGGGTAQAIYVPATSGGAIVNLAGGAAGTTGMAGGSQPLPIMQPYLAMNAVICVSGLFPSRP